MFTGIIEQTGTLVGLTDRGGVRRITVEAPGVASRLREGDSLGVSGVCLTALEPDPTYFYAEPYAGDAGPRLARVALRRARESISNCLLRRAAHSAATSCRATWMALG